MYASVCGCVNDARECDVYNVCGMCIGCVWSLMLCDVCDIYMHVCACAFMKVER